MTSPPNLPDRKLVRRSFDAAATTYDDNAFLQREIADRLFERLEYIKLIPSRTLDLGAGTGYVTKKLIQRNPTSQVIALDLAPAMVALAQKQQQQFASPSWLNRIFKPTSTPTHYAICADAEAVPLADESIDLVVSSLTLQWCNPERVAHEMARVLKPEGLFMFTTFGPDTLKELRTAFSKVDDHAHVNTFVDMHDIGDILLNAGFADPVMDCETITITYGELKTLMRELKGIGAHNLLPNRERGLMGKTRWQQLEAAYEKFRTNGKLPTTYEVVYGHAWKPQFSKRKTVDGQQAISLGEFKRMVSQ
jgi:malonyl-CoA O-methyltransferase